MNFVEEQEELSLSIWAHLELDGRRRQAKGIRLADCVVEEDDLGVDVKAGEEKGGDSRWKWWGKALWNS